jgi:hypothetical protein
VKLPSNNQRLSVIGATGSGKTNAALWHLSLRNFDRMPWIVYDFKYDDAINAIDGAQHITLSDPIPTQPGIFIVHPLPDQEDAISAHMRLIWQQERTGVYVDEGYMIGNNNSGFRALLTQGRSKKIPMIVLSQRPVWMDRFVFSESDFFQVFRLQHSKDISKMEEYIPYDLSKRLPEYHSYYYEVGPNKLVVAEPTPDIEAILDTFHTKLRRIKKVI